MVRACLFPAVVVVVAAVALPGCTALVLLDDAQLPPCAADADCPAGFLCEDGVCGDVASDVVPGAATLVGAGGGGVLGPDGVTLTIPAGAVDDALPFLIGRASATLLFDNFEPRSRFYGISPDVDLAVAAGLELPAEASCAAVGSCQIFVRPVDGSSRWESLPRENAALLRTGVVVVGVAVGAAP